MPEISACSREYPNQLQIQRLVIAPVALLLQMLVFWCDRRNPAAQSPPCRLLIWRFVVEVPVVVSVLVSAILKCRADEWVEWVAMVETLSLLGPLYNIAAIVDLAVVAGDPFQRELWVRWVHLLAIVFGIGYYYYICHEYYFKYKTADRGRQDAIDQLLEGEEFQVHLEIGCVEIAIWVFATAFVSYWVSPRHGLPLSKKPRQRAVRQQILAACLFVPADIDRFVLYSTPLHDSKPWEDLAFLALFLWDTQVYMLVTSSWCWLLGSNCCPDQWLYTPWAPGPEVPAPIESSLREELVLLTSLGVSQSAIDQDELTSSGWFDHPKELTESWSTSGGVRPVIPFPGRPGKFVSFYNYCFNPFYAVLCRVVSVTNR